MITTAAVIYWVLLISGPNIDMATGNIEQVEYHIPVVFKSESKCEKFKEWYLKHLNEKTGTCIRKGG